MKTRYLILVFLVFILLGRFNQCITLIQGLRYSVIVFHLNPHYFHSSNAEYQPLLGQNLTLAQVNESRSLMRLCPTDFPLNDHDDFSHRIVAIAIHNTDSDTIGDGQILTTGVFINENHVLTSYNPFRSIIRDGYAKNRMRIYYYAAKWLEGPTNVLSGYVVHTEKFACARAVVPHEVHNSDSWAVALHDLMVIKTEGNVTFKTPYMVGYEGAPPFAVVVGPRATELAGKDDYFGYDLKIISLGFMDDEDIMNENHLHVLDLEAWVIADCDEYLIHTGYFICVEDVNDYVGIASGAFLISDEKVFGVGCFALKRDEKNILVFTDVRPYNEMIQLTCSEADINVSDGWRGT